MPGTTKFTQAQGPLLRASDVATTLNISIRHVWTLHAEGLLPDPIRLGRCTRWRESDIRRWLEDRAAGTTKAEAVTGCVEHSAERIEGVTP
jgi:predicted DNA-binding transcriptional regulator AlpA